LAVTARLDWPAIAAMDEASLERRLIIAFEGQGYHFQHLFPNGFLTIIKDDFARHAHKQAGHFREFESKPRLIIFTSMNASSTFSAIKQPACKPTRIAASSVLQLFIVTKPDLVLPAHKFLIRSPSKAPSPNINNTLR